MDLKSWLQDHNELITLRWRSEVRVREDKRGEEGDGILGLFLVSLGALLPCCLGETRDAGEEVWQQATQLYGSLALHRGLSAGEVVEELQLLRGVILRLLLESPPEDWRGRVPQRDLMVLNRILDQGVAQATVAYTDDLFFAHLQGSGVPEGITPDVVEEMERQLGAFRRELGI